MGLHSWTGLAKGLTSTSPPKPHQQPFGKTTGGESGSLEGRCGEISWALTETGQSSVGIAKRGEAEGGVAASRKTRTTRIAMAVFPKKNKQRKNKTGQNIFKNRVGSCANRHARAIWTNLPLFLRFYAQDAYKGSSLCPCCCFSVSFVPSMNISALQSFSSLPFTHSMHAVTV